MDQFDAPNDIYHNGNQYKRDGSQTSGVDQLSALSATKVMTNGDIIFTLTGPIQIMTLMSICVTANDGTATTMQYQSVPTVGSAATISGASAALTSATAGTTVLLTPTALTTAPTVVAASAGGVQLGLVAQNHIIVKDGTIKLVIATGPTTGTWQHCLQYIPLVPGAVAY